MAEGCALDLICKIGYHFSEHPHDELLIMEYREVDNLNII